MEYTKENIEELYREYDLSVTEYRIGQLILITHCKLTNNLSEDSVIANDCYQLHLFEKDNYEYLVALAVVEGKDAIKLPPHYMGLSDDEALKKLVDENKKWAEFNSMIEPMIKYFKVKKDIVDNNRTHEIVSKYKKLMNEKKAKEIVDEYIIKHGINREYIHQMLLNENDNAEVTEENKKEYAKTIK